MPALGLPTGSIERSYGGLPTLPLVNLVAEKAITEPTQFALMSRKKLRTSSVIDSDGVGPVYAVLDDVSVCGDGGDIETDLYDNVYSGTSAEGAVTVTGPVSIAATSVGYVIAGGGVPVFWDGSDVREIDMPDDVGVIKVVATQDRYVFIPVPEETANGQLYYFTAQGSNMISSSNVVVDGLAFISAESEPDQLLDCVVWRDNLVLAGARTIEMHSPSGNADAPWYPNISSTIASGVAATGCLTLWNGMFAWMDEKFVVYGYDGSGMVRLSNAGIEELLPDLGRGVRLDSFVHEGHEYLRVRPQDKLGSFSYFDNPHLLLDAQTMEWTKWSTDGGAFKGGCVVGYSKEQGTAFQGVTFGSIDDPAILSFSALDTDDVEDAMEFSFGAGLPLDGGSVTIHNLLLRCDATPPDGADTDATVSMRFSRDKGKSWSDWDAIGLKNNKIEWRSLGMFGQPGFLAQFKTADTDEFSVSGALYNEFVAGRTW